MERGTEFSKNFHAMDSFCESLAAKKEMNTARYCWFGFITIHLSQPKKKANPLFIVVERGYNENGMHFVSEKSRYNENGMSKFQRLGSL